MKRILPFILFCQLVSGATYYVATDGLNTNPGTEAQPWLTISNAVRSDKILAGDTVLLRGGLYQEPGFTVTSSQFPSGTGVGSETTLKAYPGETPILKFDDGPDANFLLFRHDYPKQHLKFEGLTFDFGNLSPSSSRSGFTIRSGSWLTWTSCIFTNATANTVQMLGLGLRELPITGVSNAAVVGCTFVNWNQGSTTPSFAPHAIYFGVVNDIDIRLNHFRSRSTLDGESAAIHIYDNGKSPAGWMERITIEDNTIDTDDAGIFCWYARDSFVRNNILFTLSTTKANLDFTYSQDSVFEFNTVYGGSVAMRVLSYGTTEGNIGRNNILQNGGSWDLLIQADEANYFTNNVMGYGKRSTTGAQVVIGNITDDPQFVGTTTNLSIMPTSPIVGAGIGGNTVEDDITGATRPDPPTPGAFDVPTNLPPLPPTSPSPPNGFVGVDVSATLSWAASESATGYVVNFGSSDPPPEIGSQSGTTFDPGGMEPNTTYFVEVFAVNAYGASTAALTWSFTTNPAVIPGAILEMNVENAHFR